MNTRNRARKLQAGLTIAGALALLGAVAGPASADPSTGTIGQYTRPSCGYYAQYGGPGSFQDYKVVRAFLPAVTGSFDGQQVWADVEFQHEDAAGGWATYQSNWYSTTSAEGSMTGTWTSYDDGKRYDAQDDAPGASGYMFGDAFNAQTVVRVTLFWMNGSSIAGTVQSYAVGSDPTYPNSCNTGANFA